MSGSPGSGKTTLSIQFLYNGAAKGEGGLYVSLDERPETVRENLSGFGWNIDEFEKRGKLLFFDASNWGLRKIKQTSGTGILDSLEQSGVTPGITFQDVLKTIAKIVDEESITRIAVDPITSISLRYLERAKRRRALLAFFEALSEMGITSIVTSELRTSLLERPFQLEEFLSQGVILLHTLVHDGNVIRAIQVEKMRGIPHDAQLRPYQIGEKGIEVFPRDKVF